jgi:Arc/MetJ-type ribon-helix-helix transcriptional regulator
MNIVLSPETQRLLEERMKKGGYASPDEALRDALVTLDDVEGADIEDLDGETQARLELAEQESARGESQPWKEVREELRARFFGNGGR